MDTIQLWNCRNILLPSITFNIGHHQSFIDPFPVSIKSHNLSKVSKPHAIFSCFFSFFLFSHFMLWCHFIRYDFSWLTPNKEAYDKILNIICGPKQTLNTHITYANERQFHFHSRLLIISVDSICTQSLNVIPIQSKFRFEHDWKIEKFIVTHFLCYFHLAGDKYRCIDSALLIP